MMVESIVDKLGSPGRFYKLLFALLGFSFLPASFNTLATIFYGVTPPFYCRDGLEKINTTKETSDCSIIVNTSRCEHFHYDFERSDWSIVAEFDLICDNHYMIRLTDGLYFLGALVGWIVFFHLGELFGKKPVLLICLHFHIVIGVATAFLQDLSSIILFRVIQGFLVLGVDTNAQILLTDMSPSKLMSVAHLAFDIFWGIGMVIFGLMGYFIGHWRYMQFAISIPFIFTFLYYWIIPESLQWLLFKGRVNKATDVVLDIAQWNHVELQDDVRNQFRRHVDQLSRRLTQTTIYHYSDLVKTPNIRRRFLILCYTWFVIGFTYYGILYDLAEKSSSRYINLIVGGLLEIATHSTSLYLIKRINKKKSMVVCLALSCLLFTASSIIWKLQQQGAEFEFELIQTMMLQSVKVLVVTAVAVLMTFSRELLPKVLYAKAYSVFILCYRLAAIMVPIIKYLEDTFDECSPYMVYAGLMCLSCSLMFLLPDTFRKKHPRTVTDVEGDHRKASIFIDRQISKHSQDIADHCHILPMQPIKLEKVTQPSNRSPKKASLKWVFFSEDHT